MTVETEQVKVWMEAAAANLDFDEARKLRDRIALIRGGADTAVAARADTTGLAQQHQCRAGAARPTASRLAC